MGTHFKRSSAMQHLPLLWRPCRSSALGEWWASARALEPLTALRTSGVSTESVLDVTVRLSPTLITCSTVRQDTTWPRELPCPRSLFRSPWHSRNPRRRSLLSRLARNSSPSLARRGRSPSPRLASLARSPSLHLARRGRNPSPRLARRARNPSLNSRRGVRSPSPSSRKEAREPRSLPRQAPRSRSQVLGLVPLPSASAYQPLQLADLALVLMGMEPLAKFIVLVYSTNLM